MDIYVKEKKLLSKSELTFKKIERQVLLYNLCC